MGDCAERPHRRRLNRGAGSIDTVLADHSLLRRFRHRLHGNRGSCGEHVGHSMVSCEAVHCDVNRVHRSFVRWHCSDADCGSVVARSTHCRRHEHDRGDVLPRHRGVVCPVASPHASCEGPIPRRVGSNGGSTSPRVCAWSHVSAGCVDAAVQGNHRVLFTRVARPGWWHLAARQVGNRAGRFAHQHTSHQRACGVFGGRPAEWRRDRHQVE